ncbi:hypothetical protein V2E67_000597 [Citrobacter freundii]|nr:hypothetical protein [Citrobacter freundii]
MRTTTRSVAAKTPAWEILVQEIIPVRQVKEDVVAIIPWNTVYRTLSRRK